MADIGRVKGINPSDLSTPRVHRVGKTPQADIITDRVEISNTSTRIAEVARVIEMAKASPDIRMDVVEAARDKLARGDYFKPDVTRAIAEKILDEL